MPFGILFWVSIAGGFVGALDGIGGGLILTPILVVFGVDIREAIAVSAISTVVISNAASPSFLRRHLPNLKASSFLEIFAIVGALVGATLAEMTSRRFLSVFLGFVLLFSWVMLWQIWKRRELSASDLTKMVTNKETMLVGSYYDFSAGKTITYKAKHPYVGGLCMFGVGLIAGLFGGGGSVFTVLVIDLVMGFPTKVAFTMSNLMMGVIALESIGVYLEGGLVNMKLTVPVILGILPGAFFGATLLPQLKSQALRVIFLCILSFLGAQMIYYGMTIVQ